MFGVEKHDNKGKYKEKKAHHVGIRRRRKMKKMKKMKVEKEKIRGKNRQKRAYAEECRSMPKLCRKPILAYFRVISRGYATYAECRRFS